MKALKTQHGLILFAAIAILVVIPLFLVSIPPMLDLPNHLARCDILAHLPSNPALAKLYEPRQAIIPDIAMDAIIVPLAKFLPILVAGRIFCGIVLLSLFSGAFALSAALYKKITLWSFAPVLLVFNHIVTFGFLNYMLGIGLLLWALASWVWLRDGKLWIRIAVGVSFGVLLFMSHLVALFLYGCAVLGWEISRWLDTPDRKWKTLIRDLAIMGTSFVVPFILLKSSPTKSELTRYVANSLSNKFNEVVSMLRTDPTRSDFLFSVLVLGTVAVLLLSGTLKVDRRMRWTLALVTVAFLLLPIGFATTGCVDIRVPIVIAFILFAGTSIDKWTRFAQVACGLLCFAFVLRTTQVTGSWLAGNRESSQLLADFSHVPDGSVVFSASDDQNVLYNETNWNPPLLHVPVLTAGERPVFFPQIFALPTQHPLAVRPELAGLQDFQRTDPKFFQGGDEVGRIFDEIRAAVSEPSLLPPRLGAKPAFYVFVLTTPGEELGGWTDAQIIVQRPRYAIFKLTGMDTVYAMRDRYWHLGNPSQLVAGRPSRNLHP